jgi:hypothetical protein
MFSFKEFWKWHKWLLFARAEIPKDQICCERKGGIFLKSAGNIPLGRMGIFKIKRHVLN